MLLGGVFPPSVFLLPGTISPGCRSPLPTAPCASRTLAPSPGAQRVRTPRAFPRLPSEDRGPSRPSCTSLRTCTGACLAWFTGPAQPGSEPAPCPARTPNPLPARPPNRKPSQLVPGAAGPPGPTRPPGPTTGLGTRCILSKYGCGNPTLLPEPSHGARRSSPLAHF